MLMIKRSIYPALFVAGALAFSCGKAVETEDPIINLVKMQFNQVWSGQGHFLYSVKHPGRQQLIRDLAEVDEDYEPNIRDYYPEIPEDTLYYAFDRRSGLIRLDEKQRVRIYNGTEAGRVMRQKTKYVWNGFELRYLRWLQFGTEEPSLRGFIKPNDSALPSAKNPERSSMWTNGPFAEMLERNYTTVKRLDNRNSGAIGFAAREGNDRIWFTIEVDGLNVVFAVAPSMGYALTRREIPQRKHDYIAVEEVDYREYAPGIWYPNGWTREVYDRATDKLLTVNELQVLDFEVNSALPDSLFEVEFPAEVDVLDRRPQDFIERVGNEVDI